MPASRQAAQSRLRLLRRDIEQGPLQWGERQRVDGITDISVLRRLAHLALIATQNQVHAVRLVFQIRVQKGEVRVHAIEGGPVQSGACDEYRVTMFRHPRTAAGFRPYSARQVCAAEQMKLIRPPIWVDVHVVAASRFEDHIAP